MHTFEYMFAGLQFNKLTIINKMLTKKSLVPATLIITSHLKFCVYCISKYVTYLTCTANCISQYVTYLTCNANCISQYVTYLTCTANCISQYVTYLT